MQRQRVHLALEFLLQCSVDCAMALYQRVAIKPAADQYDTEMRLGTLGYIVHVALISHLEMQRFEAFA